ncbi:MAG: tetratricopeptide repeat protein, partial [Pikeienuella sp.]
MGETDHWGNAITCSEPGTAAAVRDFTHGMLTFGKQAGRIMKAAKTDDSCAIANAHAAQLMMFLEMANSPALAQPFLDRAEAASAGATDREKGVIAYTRKWVERDIPGLIRIAGDVLEDHPTDLTTVKIRQTMQFDWGDATGMLHSAHYGVKAFPDQANALGMLAFGLEESHLLSEAENVAWRALELDETEGWAQHAIAHVMLTEGRCDEGRGFMSGRAPTWEGKNSVLVAHNWWHVALFAISQGDYASALAAHDEHITGIQPDYSQDQINEISLLARLEMVGCDVGDRWIGLAERLAARSGDFVTPFLTMQYLYALARAGRGEADDLLANLRDLVAPEWSAAIWRNMAMPACEGLAAHARGDYAQAADALGRAIPLLWQGGGSHAQRDVFHQIHLDALIRAGCYGEAQQNLMGRLSFEPASVPNNRALAGVYEALGLPQEAAACAAKARR